MAEAILYLKVGYDELKTDPEALASAADRLLGGSGIAGAAASSTAGNSAAVPKAVAMADPRYAAIAPIATIQVTASVIVTAILTPILTSFVYKRVQKQRAAEAHHAPGLAVMPGDD